MTRICPACGYKVQNDLLLACPECRGLLSDDLRRLSVEEEGSIIRRLKRKIFRDMFIWWGILVILLVFGFFGLRNSLEDSVNKRLDQQVDSAEIKRMLQEIVKTKAETLIRDQIDPVIAEYREDMRGKVFEFSTYQSDMKKTLQAEYETVSNDLKKVRDRNLIVELSDEAIGDLSRPAYERLMEIEREAEESLKRMAARSEIMRIRNYFVISKIKNQAYGIQEGDEGDEGDENQAVQLTTSELIERLNNHSDGRIRALSAQLLGKRKERGVPEALLSAMKTDQNLEVLKETIKAFSEITNFIPSDLFEYEGCAQWWDESSEEVNVELAPAG